MFAPLYTFILTLALIAAYPVIAQNKVVNEIVPIFKSGSSRDLAKFLDNTVELNMSGSQGEYSRNQAELVLRDFFKKFPPIDFQIVHRGDSGSNITYYIAYYISPEQSYRVLVKTKEINDRSLIYSLDFKKE